MNSTAKALRLAKIAHKGQVRKYTGEPYINHPINVARILQSTCLNYNSDMIAAAYLHDTVEDTEVTLTDIEMFISTWVSELVYWLTDVSRPEHGNRATRKQIDRRHIAKAPVDAKNIKLCDLIDNSDSIIKYDKDFAKVYLREKLLLLDVLEDADSRLWSEAKKIVDENINLIK